jgi:hypothetical protein
VRGLLITCALGALVYTCTDWQALAWRGELAHWRNALHGAPDLETVRVAERWIKVYSDKLTARGLTP